MKFWVERVVVLKLFAVLSIIFVLMPLAVVSAAGVVFIYENGKWSLVEQEQQFSVINLHNGMQSMVLVTNTGKDFYGEKAMWAFVVPAGPKEVEISSMTEFPLLGGDEVHEEARNDVHNMFRYLRRTQLYMFFEEEARFTSADPWMLRVEGMDGALRDFNIMLEESKLDIRTKIVSLQERSQLIGYFEKEQLACTSQLVDVLQSYYGTNYSLVIAWVDDVQQFLRDKEVAPGAFDDMGLEGIDFEELLGKPKQSNFVGLALSFPSDSMFFPLKMVSIYEKKEIPIEMYIIGFAKPNLYLEIREKCKIQYMECVRLMQSCLPWDDMPQLFEGYDNEIPLPFTRILIRAQAGDFKHDLWLSHASPLSARFAKLASRNLLGLGIFFHLLASCLAGLVAGLMVFGRSKRRKWSFALLGLGNIASVVGFLGTIYFFRSKKIPDEIRLHIRGSGVKELGSSTGKLLVFAIISFLLVFAWLIIGQFFFIWPSPPILLILGFGVVISSIAINRERVLDKRPFSKEGKSAYVIFDCNKMSFLLLCNAILTSMWLLLILRRQARVEIIAEKLGFVSTYTGLHFAQVGNLVIFLTLATLCLSSILLLLYALFVRGRMGSWGIYVIPRDWKKFLFVPIFSAIFVGLTYLLQIILQGFL
jgi:hypothetical protein